MENGKWKKSIVVTLLWLLVIGISVLPAFAAEVTQTRGPASVSIDGPVRDGQVEIALSDFLKLTFQVEGGKDTEIEAPAPLTLSPGWKVSSAGKPALSARDGKDFWQWSVFLEPLSPGDNALQIEPLRYRMADGDFQTAPWAPITIRVKSIVDAADPTKIRGTPEIEELPRPERLPPWIWWAVGLAAAAAALLGFFVLTRGKRLPIMRSTPEDVAVRDIDRILAMKLPAKGHVGRFHTLLANVVRRYLEIILNIPARRRTTAEFLGALAQTQLQAKGATQSQETFLRDFLERCDLAKFAGATVSEADCEALARTARVWIAQKKASSAHFGERGQIRHDE